MLKIHNKNISASAENIIKKLKLTAAENGIFVFDNIKKSGENLQVTCPFHAGGHERRPSCGVNVHKRGFPGGVVHCFTCGWSGSLSHFISAVLGRRDGGIYGEQWLIKNFVSYDVDEGRKFDIDLDFSRRFFKPKKNYISEKELDKYRYYHDYMFRRGLTDEIIKMYDVGYDKQTQCLTFPVRDIVGNCLFLVRRSVVGKFFNYPQKIEKPLYGIYELPPSTDTIFICESVINTLTCVKYGFPSLALLGTGDEAQARALKKLSARNIVLALDGDSAGDAGSERLFRYLKNDKIITKLDIPRGKDVNDLTEKEFLSLQKYFY